MEFWLALLPIITLLGMVLFLRTSVMKAALITLVATLGLTLTVWQAPPIVVSAAVLRGMFLATEIAFIIASALVIIETLKRQSLLEPLQKSIANISSDYRVQTLLIGFALVFFFEGIAGFGTPIIIALPILVALGMKQTHAVVVTLIAATTPALFGGLGLPLTYGIESVIYSLSDQSAIISAELIKITAWAYIPATVCLALTIVAVTTWLRRDQWRHFWQIVPFAVVVSLAIALPATATALLLGPELPTVIGSLSGVIAIVIMARFNFLTPKTVLAQSEVPKNNTGQPLQRKQLGRLLWPYGAIISLLLITRLPYFGLAEPLKRFALGTQNIFDTDIGYQLFPLFSAPALLMYVAILVLIVFRIQGNRETRQVLRSVGSRVTKPLLTLMIVLIFVQLFINSSGEAIALSMPSVIGEQLARLSGQFWPAVAPSIGAIGAGVSGSTTMSNLIFSGLQFDIASSLGLSIAGILVLQLIGAALGNMIAFHNVITALAVAELPESKSSDVLRTNLKILLILLTITGLVGWLLIS